MSGVLFASTNAVISVSGEVARDNPDIE